MPTINFYCRKAKVRKNGKTNEAPIEVAITLNGQRKFYTTSLFCDYTIFKSQPPQYVTEYIDALRVRLSQTIAALVTIGVPLTAEKIRQVIRKGGVNSYTLKDLYDEFNKILQLRLKSKTITRRSVNRYYQMEQMFSKKVPLETETTDISPAIIENFYAELQGKYQDSSLSGMMTRLKTIIRFARDNGHLQINPFQNIRIKKGVKEITTITKEELDRIISKDLHPRLRKVADMFAFSAGSGLAFVDCCALSPSDFQEINGKTCIFKKRAKTNIPFYSVLLPWALDIAKKYNYDFKALKISNQKTNAYLKEIAIICNISSVKSLHFHLARHFYACYLINHKVPISSISKALGHVNNSSVTLHYARLLTDTIVQDIGAVI